MFYRKIALRNEDETSFICGVCFEFAYVRVVFDSGKNYNYTNICCFCADKVKVNHNFIIIKRTTIDQDGYVDIKHTIFINRVTNMVTVKSKRKSYSIVDFGFSVAQKHVGWYKPTRETFSIQEIDKKQIGNNAQPFSSYFWENEFNKFYPIS